MRQSRLLLIAAIVGVIAVVMSTFWLRAERETVQVVVAASPIKAGTRLTQDNLAMTKVPKNSVSADAKLNKDPLLGRFAKFDIAPGDEIIERMLVPAGATSGLASAITPGKRAFAIRVNEVAGVAGFALPGNYVDVLLSSKDGSGQPTSKVLLEHVLILAVAQEQLVTPESKPKVVDVVTLEVSPQQAEKLDMARLIGGLALALRNQNDDASERTRGVRGWDFNEGGRPSVEVIRGTDRVAGSGLN